MSTPQVGQANLVTTEEAFVIVHDIGTTFLEEGK